MRLNDQITSKWRRLQKTKKQQTNPRSKQKKPSRKYLMVFPNGFANSVGIKSSLRKGLKELIEKGKIIIKEHSNKHSKHTKY